MEKSTNKLAGNYIRIAYRVEGCEEIYDFKTIKEANKHIDQNDNTDLQVWFDTVSPEQVIEAQKEQDYIGAYNDIILNNILPYAIPNADVTINSYNFDTIKELKEEVNNKFVARFN